ncbi:MAG: 2-polyprenylphenol 6-hydroxylase [Pseudorhodobacter sp. PARRP1]|nr:MAG: 2-polyprenylphenol 6-hydroxylase [Pseudorhodobacter sp. PARRP1]
MRGPHNIWRLIRTGATFERTGAMAVALEAMQVTPRLRFAARMLGWPFKWLGLQGDLALPPITRALTALGPAYIKFGQVLSTRPDIVGEELALQLKYLQDQLPPFATEVAKARVAEELRLPVDEVFSSFSEPVAAASIAQVHRATLRSNGQDVAVKVLRPGIERAFRRDIDAFYFAARAIEFVSPASRRLRPLDVISHFEGVVLGELDLRLESSAASEFADNTKNDAGFQVPRVVWDLSGRTVMTLDWAAGINLADNAAIDAAGLDRRALGARVLQLFLSHALRDGFFHGDMHQGNLKVAANGNLIAYDFGIMGRIDEYTRRVYAEILMGFIGRDYRRVAEVHFEAGYVPPDRDIDEFARALRAVGEPIFGLEATRVSMARLLSYLFEVTERFGMETRTELILLQRTMVVVEGVARGLDPNINIWQVAKPVVETYVTRNVGPLALLRDLGQTARVLARFGPRLPRLVEAALIAQADTQPIVRPRPRLFVLRLVLAAFVVFALGIWLGHML